MKEKEKKKIIKIRLINVVFLLFLIFILIIGINSNKLTTKQKIQEAAQNALSKSNTEYLETDEFVKELNKKLGENNYKLQTSENGYLVKTNSNQTYSVTNKGRTSQLRWTTNESDNKIIDSEGNEYNIGDYIDYNPNITTDSSKIVDFVNPIWETENRKLELNDNNIATMKFTLRGSDTYYASDTIAPGTYNATSEELKKNFKVYVNAKEANSNVKITIHPGKKLMESRTIDGVTKEVQYGITYEVEIYTATENIEQVKITIPKGTIIDETKNENEEKSFIVFDVLRPTNTEKTEDSKFLNIDGIKRKDIEKITFVKSKSEVIGTNYYDVSAVGSSTIIAGYEDKDENGKYEVYIGSDFDIYVNRDTSYLFANTGITTIENINLINTINSLNMEYMFSNCANLQEITFPSKFDTKNVRNMQEMFGGCSTFKNITLNEEFNTNKVTNISKMFQNCINLTTIDFGNNFDTSNVLDASYMFNNCNKLTTIDLKEKFNTEKVTNMSYMFNNCSKLNTINLREKFDTTQVTNMSYMFNGCSTLETIDLKEKFNTNKVTNMSYMFCNCSSLRSIYVSEYNETTGNGWTTKNVTDSDEMFTSATKLVGGNGTKFNSSYIDATYARIDKEGEPGYLTNIDQKASETESYVGYYADVDGDGTVDGIIFADLLHGKTGQWGDSNGTYTIPTIESTKVKSYKISQEDYTDPLGGTSKILTTSGDGNDRFYVMDLTNVGTSEYRLANSQMSGTITTFGSGKANTQTLRETNNLYFTLREPIESKVNKGWFIPSKEEWSAFGEELGITRSNYSAKGLSREYWSSSQNDTDLSCAWYADFDFACMEYMNGNNGDDYDYNYVRMATTF